MFFITLGNRGLPGLAQPDCAILDINMPGANGVEVFLEAKRWSPKAVFAARTGYPSVNLFSSLIDAGVRRIFLKSDAPTDICSSVARIFRGQTVLSQSVIGIMGGTGEVPELTHRTNLMRKPRVQSTATLLMKSVKLGPISAH